MSREDEFDKFYKDGEYASWDPNSGVSRKTVLWIIWNAAWSAGYKDGREELAANLCRDLHTHMGKKTVFVLEE